MSTEVAVRPNTTLDFSKLEKVLIKGDLASLNDAERIAYYRHVCESVGLNPATKPFEYMQLNGKLVLYAGKGCAEQLRSIHDISIRITNRATIEGVYVVTAAAQKDAKNNGGRVDEATGAVTITGLKGDNLANAFMKAETKSKRRVTLSICGLNMLDHTEVESIPAERKFYQKPSAEDGAKHIESPTGYRISGGGEVKRGLHEIPAPELRHMVERIEAKPKPEEWETEFLPRAKEYLVTLANMEPVDETEPEEPQNVGAPPQCCGKDMRLSNFPDKLTGKTPFWCTGCKAKRHVA